MNKKSRTNYNAHLAFFALFAVFAACYIYVYIEFSHINLLNIYLLYKKISNEMEVAIITEIKRKFNFVFHFAAVFFTSHNTYVHRVCNV